MMKTNHGTKFWAFLLAFTMVLSIITFPSAALAEGEAPETGPPLLESLSVKCKETDLLEVFASGTFSYSIDAAFDADEVTIAAEPQTSGDTVEGTGEFPVAVGVNEFKVSVSHASEGADTITQEYVITINRAEEALPDVPETSLSGVTAQAVDATGDYDYTESDGNATITGYNGDGGDVVIPDSLDGYPVTAIADYAFSHTAITSIGIPAGVTSLGNAFDNCDYLETINVDSENTAYSSPGGVLFNNDQTELIKYPVNKSDICYYIPSGVTAIEGGAFSGCSNLYGVEIPSTVTSMDNVFSGCWSLYEVVFLGNCPADASDTEFGDCEELTIYYAAGKTGFPEEEWNGFPVVEFDPLGEYTVTYDANGANTGSVPAAVAYAYGAEVTVSENSGGLGKQYYTFAGWNTDEYGYGLSLASGDVFKMLPHNVTLYAAWQSDLRLGWLEVWDEGENYQFAFTPVFSPDVSEYAMSVSYDTDEIYIDADPVSGDDWVYWDTDEDRGVPLVVGENVIEITVYSGDGENSRTYTLTVTRYSAEDEKTFGYYKYIDEGDYIAITKYTGKETFVWVPAVIDSKPVRKIGMNVFADNHYIKGAALPDGLIEIGSNVFEGCVNLEMVQLPDTLTSIGNGAFSECGLSSIDLPDGLLSIGRGAFGDCWNLASVALPESLIFIDSYAFEWCTALTSFTIPDNVAYIGEPFLAGCVSLETISTGANESFTLEDGVLFDAGKTRLIKYPAQNSAMPVIDDVGPSYTIPPTVTDIDEAAFGFAQVGSVAIPEGVTDLKWITFEYCEYLSSVSLPDSLETIESYTFNGCSALVSIELPPNLNEFYGDAFYGCTGMKSIKVDSGNENFWSVDGVLYGWYDDGAMLVYYPAAKRDSHEKPSFVIPNTVEVIVGESTYNVTVEVIGYDAFVSSMLEDVTIGSGVWYIDSWAFEDCDRLTNMTIPGNVETISPNVFFDCDNLSAAVIGDGVEYVDFYAFVHCPKLAAVYFLGAEPIVDYGIFSREFNKSTPGIKSKTEHASRALVSKYSSIKTQGTVRAKAAEKLFPGSNSNLAVYKVYGIPGYRSPWYGRRVKTFYTGQTCTVTFNLNGEEGTAPDAQTVYKYGKAAQPLSPASEGNRFLGWYKEASCRSAWNFAVNTVTSNITLYAKWTNTSVIAAAPNRKYYGTVTGGGTYNDGEEVTLRATPKNGYRFLYWTETVNGIKEIVYGDPIYIFTAEASRTVTAQFAAIGKPAITSAVCTKHDSVTLTWSAVEGAVIYNVYRATSSRGTYIPVATRHKNTYFIDTGLQWGKKYYYKVSALFGCETADTEGAKSAYKSIKPSWQAPSLTASTDHIYGVKLSWTSVPDADAYYVWYSTRNGGYQRLPDKIDDTSYDVKGLTLNKTYYFKVQAVDEDDVAGPFSAYKKGKAAWTPVKLNATATYNSVSLSWNTVTDADCYYVWRKAANGTYERIPGKVYDTTYEDTGRELGKTYYYKVQPVIDVIDGDLEGPLSAYKYAKTAWPKLTLKAASHSYDSIKLTWNKVAGADKYRIYRGTSYRSISTILGDSDSLSFTFDGSTYTFTDGGLENRKYYYRVVPFDSAGGGENQNTAYKYARPAWAKVNLKAAAKTYNSIKLTWNVVAGAAGYEVQRYNAATRNYDALTIDPEDFDITEEGYISYIDKDLSTGVKYYYRVIAYDGDNSVMSSVRKAAPAWPVLKLTVASSGYNSIELSWNAIDGADKYSIYRGTSSKSAFISLGDSDSLDFIFDGSTYTFTDSSGLTAGVKYYYRVIPEDSVTGRFNPSTAYKYTKPVPSAPSVTLVNAYTKGIIGVWSPVAGAKGYEVYRATSSRGRYKKLATTLGLSFWDVGTTTGRTYYYKVRAYTLVGTKKVYGAYSTVVFLTDLPTC